MWVMASPSTPATPISSISDTIRRCDAEVCVSERTTTVPLTQRPAKHTRGVERGGQGVSLEEPRPAPYDTAAAADSDHRERILMRS